MDLELNAIDVKKDVGEPEVPKPRAFSPRSPNDDEPLVVIMDVREAGARAVGPERWDSEAEEGLMVGNRE